VDEDVDEDADEDVEFVDAGLVVLHVSGLYVEELSAVILFPLLS
jgi:hypothetical protein